MEQMIPSLLSSQKAPNWPPDVFCLCAAILHRSGAYASVVEDNPPHLKGITSAERASKIEAIGLTWRNAHALVPQEVRKWWRKLLAHSDRKLSSVQASRECCALLLDLLGVADEACVGVGIGFPVRLLSNQSSNADDKFLEEADWQLLQTSFAKNGATLCKRIHPSRARVLPKMHTPQSGLTIRSVSHYLAYCHTPDVKPEWVCWGVNTPHHALNILVVPWPNRIDPSQFVETRKVLVTDEVRRGAYGLFTFNAKKGVSKSYLLRLMDRAKKQVGRIDGVVLPELSLSFKEYDQIAKAVVSTGAFLIAGVGCKAANKKECGKNEVIMDVQNGQTGPTLRIQQKKHHRWKLTKDQIMQYGIGTNLHPESNWWEHISLKNRSLTFITLSQWLTLAALICEDLARPDPVGDLVRAVGPNLVVALLTKSCCCTIDGWATTGWEMAWQVCSIPGGRSWLFRANADQHRHGLVVSTLRRDR